MTVNHFYIIFSRVCVVCVLCVCVCLLACVCACFVFRVCLVVPIIYIDLYLCSCFLRPFFF